MAVSGTVKPPSVSASGCGRCRCRTAFLRGAFLTGGSVTDPSKRYHLELATNHHKVSRETESLMLDEDKNNYLAVAYRTEEGMGLSFCDVSTGTVDCNMGDRIKVCIDTNKIHLFDCETEKAIIN